MGAVVGATEPAHIARLRELMPRAIFLIPGVGAQGGRPELLGAAFGPGRGRGAGPGLAGDRRRSRPGGRGRAPAGRGLGRFDRLGDRRAAIRSSTLDPARPPMTKRSKAPARALAVLALIGGFVVLVVIVSVALSGGDSDDGRQEGSPATSAADDAGRRRRPQGLRRRERRHADRDRAGDRGPGREDRAAQPRRRPADPDRGRRAEAPVRRAPSGVLLAALARRGGAWGLAPRKL